MDGTVGGYCLQQVRTGSRRQDCVPKANTEMVPKRPNNHSDQGVPCRFKRLVAALVTGFQSSLTPERLHVNRAADVRTAEVAHSGLPITCTWSVLAPALAPARSRLIT